MAIIVQKFGGTSVGSLERIEAVAEQIIQTKNRGHQVVAVLSAMSGETNRLLDLAHQIDAKPSPRELDMLLASGEQVSISLLAIALIKRGYSAVSLLANQIGLRTNNRFNKARIKYIDNTRMLTELQQGHVVIVAGFQGCDDEGNITTLGRGGSDTSAVAIAASLQAKECQIFTDVDGVYTTDPRIEAQAKKLEQVSFDEMLEMASSGAKVLHSRSVEFAGAHQMPLRVLSSFNSGTGTKITFNEANLTNNPVTAIASQKDEAMFTLLGIKDFKLLHKELFLALAEADIEVDMLQQSVVNHSSNDLSFTLHRNDYSSASEIISQLIRSNLIEDYIGDSELVKLSLIGRGIRANTSINRLLFDCLHENNVELFLMSSSEIKISFLVKPHVHDSLVKALHKKFKLEQ
ncbi:aspartate kinase [Thalassomonas sp. M1454]|uniref:aspartate kinase n=1 Tax=Thalassomonas sp. M1454 TaxID=2594477 RepID=UPI00117DDC44|nr:aspartate kinase [Thalassomonas sp. M1454]TRX55799.1 aspartate kinase [Thalassomonas sp. M1454]